MHVVAGVIHSDQGLVLIARRPPGSHMAGGWEFPGGKLAPGEAPLAGLRRELREEIGIEVLEAEPLVLCRHAYADRRVLLDVWTVLRYAGEPRALEGQPLRWEAPGRLHEVDLLPADLPVVEAILAARAFSADR
ncbi:MAG: (deoxy)nucleoside triphosphate pyrophosphohydrolase [Gammaproteobacteria bacterium]|nr:(deoxy)nucleoside triphosphate pyrophosphohydrolase [Gammaproteobacteria bacterium]